MSDASEPVVEAAEPVESLDTGSETVESLDTGSETVESLDTEAGETPEVETPNDPFHEFGGRDTIEQAVRLHQAAQTEDGLIQLFIEAGRNLGLGLKEMETLFTGDQAAGADDAESDFDPEEPLTIGQFQELQRKAQEAAQAKAHEAAVNAARATVASVTAELGLDPKDPSYQLVLSLGDKHLNDDLSPENVAAAVRQGHAEYLALVEKESKRYLQTKKAKADSVPSAPAGAAAPAAEPEPEPQNVMEAIKQARKKLRASL